MPEPGGADTVLGFDYGTARVGVAVGNTVTRSADALTVIEYRALDTLFAPIADLVGQWQPRLLVVGRPLAVDGSAIAVTAQAERFARRLQGRFALPVSLVDERFSSVDAQAELRAAATDAGAEQGMRRRARRTLAAGSDDAQAAAIILRQYLQTPGSTP